MSNTKRSLWKSGKTKLTVIGAVYTIDVVVCMFLFSYKKEQAKEDNWFYSLMNQLLSLGEFERVSTALFISVYVVFIYMHLTAFLNGAALTVFLFMCLETMLILVYLVREKPKMRTIERKPWLYALVGTFLPLTLYPNGMELFPEASMYILFLGILCVFLSYLSLNRSMGVGPALRTVKTRGMYRFIRHPMYASYFVMYFSYVLASMHFWNVFVVACTVYFQYMRTRFEEELLEQSEEYKEYKQKVRWRFIPKVL